jgi:hypothetical protein
VVFEPHHTGAAIQPKEFLAVNWYQQIKRIAAEPTTWVLVGMKSFRPIKEHDALRRYAMLVKVVPQLPRSEGRFRGRLVYGKVNDWELRSLRETTVRKR